MNLRLESLHACTIHKSHYNGKALKAIPPGPARRPQGPIDDPHCPVTRQDHYQCLDPDLDFDPVDIDKPCNGRQDDTAELLRKRKPQYPASSVYYVLAKSRGYGLQYIDNLERLIELKFISAPKSSTHFSGPFARVETLRASENTCTFPPSRFKPSRNPQGRWMERVPDRATYRCKHLSIYVRQKTICASEEGRRLGQMRGCESATPGWGFGTHQHTRIGQSEWALETSLGDCIYRRTQE